MRDRGRDEHETFLADLLSTFGLGLGLLVALAVGSPTVVNRRETLETFASFEAAHRSLAALDAEGKIPRDGGSRASPGPVVFSVESLARVAALGVLLRLPPKSPGSPIVSGEVRSLADLCVRALMASPRPAAAV